MQKDSKCWKNRNLDNDDGLLYNIVDFGLNQVKQCAHTTLGCLLHLDGTTADSTHRLPHKVDINFSCISNNISTQQEVTALTFSTLYYCTVTMFNYIANKHIANTISITITIISGLQHEECVLPLVTRQIPSNIDRFSKCEIVGPEVVLDCLHQSNPRPSVWSLPIFR